MTTQTCTKNEDIDLYNEWRHRHVQSMKTQTCTKNDLYKEGRHKPVQRINTHTHTHAHTLSLSLSLSGVCNMKRFLCEFKQRLIDCCLQDWHSAMASKDRLAFYSSFKKSLSLADYLFTIKKAVLRKHLVRFRLGVFPLKTHRLRYSERTPDNFTCPFCDTNESEIHFVVVSMTKI